MEMGDHENAELMFYLARQIDDDCPQCYYHMGRSLEARGLTRRAMACWDKSLRLDSNLEDAHRRMALAHWSLGELESARQHFAAELRLVPNHPEALVEFGSLFIQMEDPHGAARMFERAIELDPEDTAAYACLADVYLLMGYPDDAHAVCRTALKLEPHDPMVLGKCAKVCLEKGLLDKARRHLDRALATAPDEPELQQLGLALTRMERLPRVLLPLVRWKNALVRWFRRRRGP
jgi:import receptor subunit TOM70